MKKQVFKYVLQTEVGNQIIGATNADYNIHFQPVNFLISESEHSTVNSGEMTTEERVEKHLNKYKNVWQALS